MYSFSCLVVNHKNDKFRWVLRSMIDLVAQYWKVWQQFFKRILPKNSVLGEDNKRFDLVVTNSKNSVNTYAFSRIIQFTSHQKIKSQIRTAKFAMKIFSKIHTFFFVMHTFAKAIIIFFVCTEPGWMDWKKNWDFSGRESQL